MKWQGRKLSYKIYGQSHSPEIGIKAKGLPSFKLDLNALNAFMNRRKASGGVFSTSRIEPDEIIFNYGLKGDIIEESIYASILNKNVKSGDYAELYGKPRPSHADYVSFAKFNRLDFSGGKEFSARLTAPYCILGGIAKQILLDRGITVNAFISRIGNVCGKSQKDGVSGKEIEQMIRSGDFALTYQQEMLAEIGFARADGNSVGGVIDCVVEGVPAGVGYTLAEGLESSISAQVFAVPAVKGIEFGAGFDLAVMLGSQANDEFYYDGDRVKTYTNNAGGINGGISNGNQITLSVAMRPTPSIFKEQRTVDLVNKTNTVISIKGRHDACIAVRAIPVIESAVAIAILDNIL